MRARFPQITRLDVARIIALFEQALMVGPQDLPSVCRDPHDDKFLACAIAAGAEYLVTEDQDMLALATCESTRICQPDEFIAFLESKRTWRERQATSLVRKLRI